jgi:hypothetical protein
MLLCFRDLQFDSSRSGGDNDVSMYFQFRLIYGNEITPWISANAAGSTCSGNAAVIESALEAFNFFDDVTVTGTTVSASSMTCKWTVSFISSIGNIDELTVMTRNSVSGAEGNIGQASVAGDDTITIATTTDGENDAIKAALEELDNIGTVTVTAVSSTQGTGGICSWRVTFDTNAGDLNLLNVRMYSTAAPATFSTTGSSSVFSGTTVQLSQVQAGTSQVIGGNFALTFRSARTVYVPFDSSARTVKNILEALPTIGQVDVTRSSADENGGYTWLVTFLTELGSLDLIQFDNQDMTGTVVTGKVYKDRVGISPPFNSLDFINNLPLGSAVITDLSNLEITVDSLDEGIAFYFRVAAINSVGQGPFAFSSVPYAIPMAQRPGRPTNAALSVIDGTTLDVQFDPATLDGGEDVTFYRVEYAQNAFVSEVQQISASCAIVNEVQVLNISTLNGVYEEQLLFIHSSYGGTVQTEIQHVTCDATGGYFRLKFNGITSPPINYDANSAAIINALQQIETVNTVSVSFVGTQTTACFERTSATMTNGFRVTFTSVQNMAGDLPMMEATTNSLDGARYVAISEAQKGSAPIGGKFKLSFRGSVTEYIDVSGTSYNAIAADIQTKLQQLDTISTGGVTVSSSTALLADHSQLYRIKFAGSALGGDVEAIENVDYFNLLTGSDVTVSILTDGLETSAQRGFTAFPSVKGNEVGGTFTLTYRGHTTSPIDFNVADTVLKSSLEALPNINTVAVHRTGPTVFKEYTWSITFLSMPGAYPDGTENVQKLVPRSTGLTGTGSAANVRTVQQGSNPLGGTFSLIMTTANAMNSLLNVTEIASSIPADASASELQAVLNSLQSIGTVSVSRRATTTGFQWLVTFDGCKIVNGVDVCNMGDVDLLGVNNTLMQCAPTSHTSPVSINQVARGSGPGTHCVGRADHMCYGFVTDLSVAAPYHHQITGLTAGTPYYVRVAGHNSVGYGYPAITVPEYQVPTYNPPGPPPPVRLVSSTSNSITVEWDPPRENGGANVEGYQLWVDDWAGGNMRLAYDGIDQPGVLQFTVSATTSFVLENSKSYRFFVRAVNYCFATESEKACMSEFSPSAVFTVRQPRAPLAPPMPYRHASSDIGGIAAHDGSITIRWNAPIDNGGSPITSYTIYVAPPNSTTYAPTVVSPVPTINTANGYRVFERTYHGLWEGNVYRFYVVAQNAVSKSASSPILSVVVGMLPGIDAFRTNTYAAVSPKVTAVSSSEIALYWPMPASSSAGGIPITGYKVYRYAGIGLNTLANPLTVFNEVQKVQTYVDPMVSAVQRVSIPATSSSFFLTGYGKTTSTTTLTPSSSQAAIAAAINSMLSTVSGFSSVSVTVGSWVTANGFKYFDVTFNGYDGPVTNLAVSTSPVSTTSTVTTLRAGTAVIGGSFTLSFKEHMSVDLPFDVSAVQMKASLEDLPGVGTVTVNRTSWNIAGANRNAFVWLVTFDSAAGDLPMLYATPGRLTPVASHVGISVTQYVRGTPAELVYDGTGVPDVRTTTVTGLVSDMTYSFKVAPINALGDGVLSAATATVVASSGASPVYTTARGTSLQTGITYDVDEEQVINAIGCGSTIMSIRFGSAAANFTTATTDTALTTILEGTLKTGDVDVTHRTYTNGSQSITSWRVVFIDSGDVASLVVTPLSSSCHVQVEEFIKGSRNQFTIEPKSASGATLRDVTTAAGFEGKDVFFTETYFASNNSWLRDQGVAAYNPQVYEVQQVTVAAGSLSSPITLVLSDYLTPYSAATFTTTSFTAMYTPFEVQQAIESLANVDSVDVERHTGSGGQVYYLVTFMSNLGDVPSMTTSTGGVTVTEVVKGACEVQTITIASDQEFTREENVFEFPTTATSARFMFLSNPVARTISSPINAATVTAALEGFFGPNGAPVDVTVTMVTSGSKNIFTVTFISPVGDVGSLTAEYNTGSGFVFATVVEQVKGVSPVTGSFTVFYEGYFTDDIQHDASAADVKAALEALPTINAVKVLREDTNNGFKWTVSFSQNVGNLRMMEATDYRYEIQRLWTTGGTPTPLSGQIIVFYGGDSVLVDYDASAAEMQAALESMPSIGHVEVSRDTNTNGQNSWMITFRDLIGNIENHPPPAVGPPPQVNNRKQGAGQ